MENKNPRDAHSDSDFGFVGSSKNNIDKKSGGVSADSDTADKRQPGFAGWLDSINAKAEKLSADFDKAVSPRYLEPDEATLIPEQKAWKIYGISTGVIFLLAAFMYFFIGQFSFYTTGVKVDDFVESFNSIVSDTDMRSIIPEYEDIQIPADARLGKKPVSLCNGDITLDADVRFGKIVSLSVTANTLHNYDPETRTLDEEAESADQYYFFAAMGKAIASFDYLEGKLSGFEPNQVSVFDVAELGYSIHRYAAKYNETALTLGALDVTYTVPELTLTIQPTITTLAEHINDPETPTVLNFVPETVSAADTAANASGADVQ